MHLWMSNVQSLVHIHVLETIINLISGHVDGHIIISIDFFPAKVSHWVLVWGFKLI